ncbi:hypothetical protein BGZ58_011254 [Dissophora ornata]|nr:hypothetical protein BGZ58_011254 [Dissophora ornata]
MVQFDNNLWVFGGRTISGTTAMVPVTDTPTFDLSANTWSNRTQGLQRYGHASARAGADRIVTCYGMNSTSASATLDADCVYFSISTAVYTPAKMVWTNSADAIQGGRTGHSLVSSLPNSNILYLFGGMNTAGTQYFQDVYQLDTSKMPTISITKITAAAASLVPSARAKHAAVTVGSEAGFMIVHGGLSVSNNTMTMASVGPYIFSMSSNTWINSTTFVTLYQDQAVTAVKNVSVAIIIVGILAGVSVLGAGVAFYIWKGLRDDELERQRNEAAENQAGSPTSSTMEDSPEGRKRGAERKSHSVYPFGAGEEDHSLATGPFKSTSSLIQAGDAGKKLNKKNSTDAYQSNRVKPRANGDPYSPGGTTLTESGSMNGYISSSVSSSTPTRLNKNNSNGSSSQYSNRKTTAAANAANGGTSINEGSSNAYYNPRDLYVDEIEDDDSSITVSLASESTMGSPWAGPARMSMDLAPPNPRFSKGAISQAHRQLVGAITTNQSAVGGNRNSQGWDTGSPGGSLSSRDDSEHQRRSVNSMQWVSFDPHDLSGRPESGVYDPLSQRSLTVRNTSMYGANRGSIIQSNGSLNNTQTNNNNNPRASMFDGSNTSDTNTEDSGSYYSGPGGKQISAALAARQQRRSMRNSRDSQLSASASGTEAEGSGEPGDVIVTRVIPFITTKVTKPTVAKIISNPRGPRIAMANEGERSGALVEEESDGSGLGIDFSAFTTSDSYGGGNNRTTNKSSVTNAAAYQTRRPSSTLNPSYNRNNNGTSTVSGTMPPAKRESKLSSGQRGDMAQPNVVLRMPPPPRHGTNSGPVRASILELGQDMPGFLNYGDNNM